MANSKDNQPMGIELAPGDEPRAVEQINGDLLVPRAARPLIESTLLMAEEALPEECQVELRAIESVRRLMGIQKVDLERERELAQMLLVRPI